MKLCVFNGSPRGEGSNTRILLEHLCSGFAKTVGNSFDLFYLNKSGEAHRRAFMESDTVLLAHPLYTDAMPAIVKRFIDSLADTGPFEGKRIIFLIQSGFPEARHSAYLARYYEKLSARLKLECLGIIIRGGVEGIQIMPPFMTGKLFRSLNRIGEHFGRTGELPAGEVKKLAGAYRLSATKRYMLRLFDFLGLANFYWNMNMRKNRAMDRRFDRPYEPGRA